MAGLAAVAFLCAGRVQAATSPAVAPPALTVPKLKALDADNHNIPLNRPGLITVVIGTSEDSQDAARRAGKAMYTFQGKTDFELIVVVDLRDSIAAWVPSVVIDHMRKSLDGEAEELKPYYLKNGNRENPRRHLYVVPDFKGTVVPQLNWSGTPDELHATIFGAQGQEVKKYENVDNMEKFQADVRAALQSFEASQPKPPPPPAKR